MTEENPYDHFCGLNGFDPYRNTCPACSYSYYLSKRMSKEETIAKIYNDSGLPTKEQHQKNVEFVRNFLLRHRS